MPLVSLLIAAYNAQDSIARALEAAQVQTLWDIEIIVIDDASTDRTAEVVLGYARLDSRVRLKRQLVNGGPAAARNVGVKCARGEWIALLDADDTMTADRLEKLVAAAGDKDVLVADNLSMYDVHAGRTSKLGIDPSVIGSGLRLSCREYVERCRTNQPNAVDFGLLKPLIRTAHIRNHGILYDDTIRYGEDFRFYLDVLLAGGALHLIPDACYRYTERMGSVSGKVSGLSKTEARYDTLERQTRDLIADPRYSSVALELTQRADAIRRLAKVAVFGSRSRTQKYATLPATLTDADMRAYFYSRLHIRFKALRESAWMKSTLIKDAANLCAGQGIKLVLQAIYFVFIARSLGPSQYGAFVAITAMTSIIGPYIGLGCGNLFLKNVRAGKRSAPLCWGNGLLITVVSGFLTTVVLAACSNLWLRGFPVLLVAAICFSDLILMRIIDLASFGFAASGNMAKTAVQNTTMSLLRVIGIVLLATCYHQVSIQQWAWVYLGTGIVGALFALHQGGGLWGMPTVSLAALMEDAREGCFFSISTSAQTIYNDIDKTMLARLSSFAATGVYAAAYRIIDTSLTPVRSLVSAAYPQFFRIGTDGLDASYGYARRLIRKALLFGVADFIGLMLIAPILPHLLGPKYMAVAPAIRLLAFIPVLRCVHWFLADALSGADAQGVRTAVQVGVAVLNIALNLVILPRWSWVGAAWTSIASDLVLMLAIYMVIRWKLSATTERRELVHAME